MHFDDAPEVERHAAAHDGPWWKDVTRYQWFVFIVASLGWLFDTMDQQLFNLARNPAVRSCSASSRRYQDGCGRRQVRRLSRPRSS